MAVPQNTLLIEGSFQELVEELAHYIDEIQRRQGDDSSHTWTNILPLLESGSQDDVLKKIVTASAVLNATPEKGLLPHSTFSSRRV